ncbi:MAG: RDD family protein [Phycisphaerae bacterium]|nr:RDD family protein [Phycisphaerae bacterium]
MNKTIPYSVPTKTISLTFLVLAMLVSTILATDTLPSPTPAPPKLLTTGDPSGLYMVLPRPLNGQNGFYIYHRKKTDSRFIGTAWYQGQPIIAQVFNGRLHLFFEKGSSMSYNLFGNQTEKRIPTDYDLIACTASADQLLALVRPKAAQPQTDPAAPDHKVSGVNKGLVILKRKANTDWDVFYSLPSVPDTLSPGQLKLASYNDTPYLFALIKGQIFLFDINNIKPPTHLSDALTQVKAFMPIVLNQEMILTVAHGDNAGDSSPVQLSIGRPGPDGQWTFGSPLLSNTKPLTVSPENISVTAYGQNLAFFNYQTAETILWGQYSPAGKELATLTPIPALQYKTPPWLKQLENFSILPLLITLFLLYIYRKEAFNKSQPLMPHIQLAPFITRVIAFIFDLSILSLLSDMVIQIASINTPTELLESNYLMTVFIDQVQQGAIPPHILNYIMTTLAITYIVTVIYFTAFEMLLSATPGKFAMNMVITDVDGKKPTLKQIVIRNLVRFFFLEFYPIILFTYRRQRIGDLLAKTIVVTKKIMIRPSDSVSKGNNFDQHDAP